MEKLQAGTLVKHKEFEIEGIVISEIFVPDFYMIEITKGTNPHIPTSKTYTASVENLIILDGQEEEEVETDSLFEAFLKSLSEDGVEEETEDTYDVELEMVDGTIIRFDSVIDLLFLLSKTKEVM